jgi:hypothetical protein
MSDLHPTKIPALVDALEAKVLAEPRSERDKALDEAIFEVRFVRDDVLGDDPMWGGIRALFNNVIDRIDTLREASHG